MECNLIGFTGVLIIIRPGLAGFAHISMALASVILITIREILHESLIVKFLLSLWLFRLPLYHSIWRTLIEVRLKFI